MQNGTTIVEVLQQIGGRVWQKENLFRVYFNDLPGLYGLEVTRYKTGNISSAQVNGKPVSNSEAKRILIALNGQFWYDVPTRRFVSKGIDEQTTNALKERVLERVEKILQSEVQQ